MPKRDDALWTALIVAAVLWSLASAVTLANQLMTLFGWDH
jgi:hypothetical protein